MKAKTALASLALLAGCAGSEPPIAEADRAAEPSAAPTDEQTIRSVAERFLSSVVGGDASEAMRWLTPLAAERAAADPAVMAPLGFAVSAMEVVDVRVLSDFEAAAQCWLTEAGVDEPEEVCCLLKRGQQGWRVCGIACDAGPGRPPAVISFEPAAPGAPSSPGLPGERFVEESSADSTARLARGDERSAKR